MAPGAPFGERSIGAEPLTADPAPPDTPGAASEQLKQSPADWAAPAYPPAPAQVRRGTEDQLGDVSDHLPPGAAAGPPRGDGPRRARHRHGRGDRRVTLTPSKVTEGLFQEFGPKRVRDTPISEGFIGIGIEAATLGLRPVMEIMTILRPGGHGPGDQPRGQDPHHVRGKLQVPLVIRMNVAQGRDGAALPGLRGLVRQHPGPEGGGPHHPTTPRG